MSSPKGPRAIFYYLNWPRSLCPFVNCRHLVTLFVDLLSIDGVCSREMLSGDAFGGNRFRKPFPVPFFFRKAVTLRQHANSINHVGNPVIQRAIQGVIQRAVQGVIHRCPLRTSQERRFPDNFSSKNRLRKFLHLVFDSPQFVHFVMLEIESN